MSTITIQTPEKLIVSENGNPQSEPKQAPSAINKLLESNTPVVVWLIFLAIGGGILALYHARIGYLPDIEWKAALIYLFIGSIVGGVIGLLLTMSLYLPGVIWSETIVNDPCLRFFYTSPGNEQSGTTPSTQLCIRSIFAYLGLPFLFVLLVSHIALRAGKVAYLFIAAGLLVLTFLLMKILLKYRLRRGDPTQRLWSYLWSNLRWATAEGRSENVTAVQMHVFKLSSAFTLSVLLNQVSMYVIYWLSGSPTNLSTFVVLTLLCTAGVWIACHVVALRHRDHPRQALIAALVVAGFLLFSADKFSSLSTKLMNHYGIGEDQQVNLLLSENGKKIVEGLGLSTPCTLPKMCKVEIFSKVGGEYFLSVGGKTFTLPKSDVIAIQADDRTRPDQH